MPDAGADRQPAAGAGHRRGRQGDDRLWRHVRGLTGPGQAHPRQPRAGLLLRYLAPVADLDSLVKSFTQCGERVVHEVPPSRPAPSPSPRPGRHRRPSSRNPRRRARPTGSRARCRTATPAATAASRCGCGSFDRQGRVRERHLTPRRLPRRGEGRTRRSPAHPLPVSQRHQGHRLSRARASRRRRRAIPLPAGAGPRAAHRREEKQDSFVGSDFTYEDIGGRDITDYTYALADRRRDMDGAGRKSVAGLEARVKGQGSACHVSTSRLDSCSRTCSSSSAAENFNRRDEVVKTFEVRKLEQVDGIWTALELVMENVRDRTRTETERDQGRVQRRPEGNRLHPPGPRAGRPMIGRRQPAGAAGSSAGGGGSRASSCSARSAFAPSADFATLDNDMTAWFSRQDPVYVEYERFRHEFGGTRTLIVALEGDAILSPAGLEPIREVTREIERVDAVDRVQSLTTATVVTRAAGRRGRGRHRASTRWCRQQSTPPAAATVRSRALGDRLLRGDLVSEDGRVTAIIVSFDERPHRRGPRRRHPEDSRRRRPPPAGGPEGVLQRQPGDQRELQPRHARQPASLTPSSSASCCCRSMSCSARWPGRCWSSWRSSPACSGRWGSTRCWASPTTSSPACCPR